MFGAEQGQGAAAGEVRLVPMSSDVRDMLAAYCEQATDVYCEARVLVAAWDAAVPGVVDARAAAGHAGARDCERGRHDSEFQYEDEAGAHYLCRCCGEQEERTRAAAGGEAAVERSLASRGDVVWTVDDLPHLLDEPVERPSVSLRECMRQVSYLMVLKAGWVGDGDCWEHDAWPGEMFTFSAAIDRQIKREAEEGEAEEGERDE